MAIKTVDELLRIGPINIEAVDVVRLSVPMIEPFRISSGEVSRKDALVIRLRGHNAFGWGESSAMPGSFYSQDTPDSCERQLLELMPSLVGKTFASMGDLEANLLGLNLSPFVRVAVETAVWEMLARAAGVSLRDYFGLSKFPVPTGLAVGLYPTLDELHNALKRYRVGDYSRLKIKIKRGYDVELVEAVRQWYGNIRLFVDANADYSEDDIDTFKELDTYDLMMFEQPFTRSDIDISMRLQREVRTPICFDEGIESAADVHHAALLHAARIVNIKLQRVGGYLEAFRIIEACVQCKIPYWMGTMPELGIGSAQALVLATHPACTFPTDVEPSSRWYKDDILNPVLEMHQGMLEMPSGPGLGFVVDEAAIERYALKRWSF
jgi:O-succinylbenzoate synthase